MRCIHCYNDSGSKQFRLMPSVIEKIIRTEAAIEETSITLSGGEPLKHPEIFKFLDIISSKKIKTRIITNATLINPDIAQRLSKYDIDIQVSINGTKDYIHDKICGNGSFEKTMVGTKNLLNVGLADRIIGKAVLNSFNKNNLLDLIHMFIELGILKIDIGALTKMGRTVTNYENLCIGNQESDEILKSLFHDPNIKKMVDSGELKLKIPELTFGCPILDETQETVVLGPRIAADGYVYICQLFSDPEYSIGNINESTMEEILKSDRLADLIIRLRKGQQQIEGCEKCVWKASCFRGCIGMAVLNGKVNETDGQCDIRKKVFMQELKKFVSNIDT